MEHTYLMHYGTLGQKWGIRKYQNPDGSLTPAGKLRYYKADGTPTKAGQKYEKKLRKAKKEEERQKAEEAARNRFKPASEMSEQELRQTISKLELEKQYNDLVKSLTPAKKATIGQRIASAAGDAVVDGIKKGGSQFLTNYMSKKGEYLGSNQAYKDQTERVKALNTKEANKTARLTAMSKAEKLKNEQKYNRENQVDYDKVSKAAKLIKDGKIDKKEYDKYLTRNLNTNEMEALKSRFRSASGLKRFKAPGDDQNKQNPPSTGQKVSKLTKASNSVKKGKKFIYNNFVLDTKFKDLENKTYGFEITKLFK
jgi:hypothetical protein